MANLPDLLANLVEEERPELVATTLMLDQELLDWLGELGRGVDRSRSYVLRGILRPLMVEDRLPKKAS